MTTKLEGAASLIYFTYILYIDIDFHNYYMTQLLHVLDLLLILFGYIHSEKTDPSL